MRIIMKTDVGRRRTNNEDVVQAVFNRHEQPLLVLCDGVGGAQFGEVAAKMCANYLITQWEQMPKCDVPTAKSWLKEHIGTVNTTIHSRGNAFSDLKGMSTTLVCATIIDNQLIVAYVGDSRLYIYRYPQLKQITRDHSLVNYLIDNGEVSLEDADTHPMRHVITRAMGSEAHIDIDFVQVTLLPQDIILLCSDGLSDMVSDEQMIACLNKGVTAYEQINALVKLANENGGKDNISVILGYYDEKGGEI